MATLKTSAAVNAAIKPTVVRKPATIAHDDDVVFTPEPVTQASTPSLNKRTSPLSLAEFTAKAQPVQATLDGKSLTLDVKEFSTGSFGWNSNGKVTVMVDGKPVTCQLSLNLTVVGSKEAPRT